MIRSEKQLGKDPIHAKISEKLDLQEWSSSENPDKRMIKTRNVLCGLLIVFEKKKGSKCE